MTAQSVTVEPTQARLYRMLVDDLRLAAQAA